MTCTTRDEKGDRSNDSAEESRERTERVKGEFCDVKMLFYCLYARQQVAFPFLEILDVCVCCWALLPPPPPPPSSSLYRPVAGFHASYLPNEGSSSSVVPSQIVSALKASTLENKENIQLQCHVIRIKRIFEFFECHVFKTRRIF